MSWLHKHPYAHSVPIQKPRFTFCSACTFIFSASEYSLSYSIDQKPREPEGSRGSSAVYRIIPDLSSHKELCLICSFERIENEASWKIPQTSTFSLGHWASLKWAQISISWKFVVRDASESCWFPEPQLLFHLFCPSPFSKTEVSHPLLYHSLHMFRLCLISIPVAFFACSILNV